MSSRTSSRSTLTTVPSTMSPSLKYLIVSSIAARNASSDPMSLTATWGVEWACVVLVMCGLAPDADRESCGHAGDRASDQDLHHSRVRSNLTAANARGHGAAFSL